MMPDREKIIKELEDIQKHLETGYSFVISWKSELIREAIYLLKEQDNCENCAIAIEDRQSVVRCKDCKHGYKCEFDIRCENKNMPSMFGQHFSDNWFCADGERKSADEKLMDEMDADPLG